VRRPVAKKVADIGIWRLIIATISKLAILTNVKKKRNQKLISIFLFLGFTYCINI
jgi:hypothetical protein